jgi:hypothetical protein
MFDFFFDLFRKEKPLYRWRERPSASEFLIEIKKQQKPNDRWIQTSKLIGSWFGGALLIGVFMTVLAYAKQPESDVLFTFFKGYSYGLFLTGFILVLFSGREYSVVELYKDHLKIRTTAYQSPSYLIPYNRLEYFRITQMRHASGSARFPCVALYTNLGESDQVDTFGLPNPKVAARVQAVLSKYVPFRASEPSDDLEFELK